MKRKGLAKMFMMIFKREKTCLSLGLYELFQLLGVQGVKYHMYVPRDITFNTIYQTKNDTSHHNKDILISL